MDLRDGDVLLFVCFFVCLNCLSPELRRPITNGGAAVGLTVSAI